MIDIDKINYDKQVPIEFLIRELFAHLEDAGQGFEAVIGKVFNGELKLVYEPEGTHVVMGLESWQPVSMKD